MERMSAANLIILGLLMDTPMSAYDMAHLIESQVIGQLIKISSPTVYKNIKALYGKGYLSVETSRTGEQPEKKIYTVTDSGLEHFQSLMAHFSEHLTPHFFEFNAFLFNIDKLDKDTGLEKLTRLKSQIEAARDWIVRHEEEVRAKNIFFAGKAIIKQYRMTMNALVGWIDEVIDDFQKTDHFGSYSAALDDHTRHFVG